MEATFAAAEDIDELLGMELSNLEPLSLMTFSGALEMYDNKLETLPQEVCCSTWLTCS